MNEAYLKAIIARIETGKNELIDFPQNVQDNLELVEEKLSIKKPTVETMPLLATLEQRKEAVEEVEQAEKLMPTESELVKQSIEQKLQEITDYDSSDSVNSFSINGVNMWLDFDERARIRVSIDAYKANGNTTMEKYFNGTPFSFPLEVWTQMLNMLEVYASEALNVTEKHKMDVSNLTTVQDVLSYNYKTGYPQKLSF